MIIQIEDGKVRHIYTEKFDQIEGKTNVTRASHVEPDESGGWKVDFSPIGGEVVAGFKKRSEALQYEEGVVNEWLIKKSSLPSKMGK